MTLKIMFRTVSSMSFIYHGLYIVVKFLYYTFCQSNSTIRARIEPVSQYKTYLQKVILLLHICVDNLYRD